MAIPIETGMAAVVAQRLYRLPRSLEQDIIVYFSDPAEIRDVHDLSEASVARGSIL
jgi:hypothetical protein